MENIDTANAQLVGVQGNLIRVMMPKTVMTKEEALVHAAWLVSMACDDERFKEILQAVRNT